MQFKPIEITVISAKGLKRVKHLTKMDVYVVVSISGRPETEKKSPVDKRSGPDPNWNYPMTFQVEPPLNLSFRVMCRRHIHSDKDIGQVDVPVSELLENGDDGRFVKYVSYQLKKPNGKHRGQINLSYKLGEALPPAGMAPWPQSSVASIGYIPVYGSFGKGVYVPFVAKPESDVDASLSGELQVLRIGEMPGNGEAGA